MYPSFDPSWLLPVRLALEAMRDDPLWLERVGCPYDEGLKEALRALKEAAGDGLGRRARKERTGEGGEAGEAGEGEWEVLRRESQEILQELQELRETVEITDVRERIAIMKTAAQLIEKMLGSGERAMNLKRFTQYQAAVVRVFDEVLSPEQRTLAIEKLKQASEMA